MRELWRKIQLPAKLALSLAILWVLATRVDWAELGLVFRGARYSLLVASFLVLEIQQFLMVLAWRHTLQRLAGGIGLWPVLYSHVVGNFWGTLLPTTLGLDVIRALSLRKFGPRTVDSATTLVVTRAMGFGSLFFLASCAFLFPSSRDVMRRWGPAVLASFAIFLAFFLTMLKPALLKLPQKLASMMGMRGLSSTLGQMQNAFQVVLSRFQDIAFVFGLSILYQLLGVYVVYLLGLSLSAQAGFAAYLFVVPAVTIITAIPISVAGLGVREASFVVLLGQVGVPAEIALSVSLLFFAQALFLALQGGAVYWLTGGTFPIGDAPRASS